MVLQTTQLQSSQSYSQAETFSLSKKSFNLWLKQLQFVIPILKQCAVISRLNEQDWQQVFQGIYLSETGELKQENLEKLSESNPQLKSSESHIAHCSTLLRVTQSDWRSLTCFLVSSR